MPTAGRSILSHVLPFLMVWLALVTSQPASAQSVAQRKNVGRPSWPPAEMGRESDSERSIRTVVNALRANPAIAPYPIKIGWQAKRVTVSGKVGSRAAYDQTIRTLIDLGIPFREALMVDTGEDARLARAANAGEIVVGVYPDQVAATLPYVYPPPILGRIDEPFAGLEPPAVSFSPFAPRQDQPRARMNVPQPTSPAGSDAPVLGKARISIDESGRVLLQGVVADEQTRAIIEQEAASVPGVSQVINELTVENPRGDAGGTTPGLSRPMEGPRDGVNGPDAVPPPPPPMPMPPRDFVKRTDPPVRSLKPATQNLPTRIEESISAHLGDLKHSVKVAVTGSEATLSGKVPSAYEAMLAYREALRTPGITQVVDRLEYPLPDEESINPLLQKGRPEDVEPYLADHIKRNLGKLADVDGVTIDGKFLKIHATVTDLNQTARVAATLRSMPILRGFQIEPSFHKK